MSLTEQQIERYSRHILLSEIGGKGQARLLAGRVLLVGLGGLGSPAALYLAAAGVGTIGLMDPDAVDLSNLQRQVIHATADLGVPKVESAAAKLRALNPDVNVRTYRERLTAANAHAVLAEYDFVIDGTDSIPAKFLIADACHFAGKPYSHAGITRFRGQTMTVLPGRTACYRCVFGAPPPADAGPSCAQAGVLGVVPGVLGTLQAAEALKFLLGQGRLLTDALLTYDALDARVREVTVRRNPECPLCGTKPSITGLREVPTDACDPKTCRCNRP
jgi:molybdopterin/thiamine biosynthesis adenylyltransferase